MSSGLARAAAILLIIAPFTPAGADLTSLDHNGRWFTDGAGRVVIMHGVNVVRKIAPYEPSTAGFGEDDASFLAEEGFDNVRLGIIYKGLEPSAGVFNDTYLENIAQTAHLLGTHGLRVFVDFHQDMFNETFNGEGFPDWAVLDDGLPHQPDGGFPANYFAMPALWRAYDHLWANDTAAGAPLQDRYAAAWAHAATRLSLESAVAGYDVFNEPWPGSAWTTCLNPDGCRLFDETVLTPFYKKVFQSIRAVDSSRLVMYETHPIFAGGADVHIGDTSDSHAAFSFHVYCLGATVGIPSEVLGDASCPLGEDRPFDRAEAQAARTGDALILSEFGATDDLSTILRDVDAADRHMVSWQYWTYYGQDPCCARPQEGIIIDPSQPPSPGNVKQDKLDALVRPYPRAVAGIPLSYIFHHERADGLFELSYTVNPGITAPTEIFVPLRQYPGGYAVTVTGPASITSAPGARILALVNTGTPGTVTVVVTRPPLP
jgi:endoglycosylceramidase